MNQLDPTVMVAETRIVIDSRAAIDRTEKAKYAFNVAKEKLDSAMGMDPVWRNLTVRRAKIALRAKVVKDRLMKDPKIAKLSDEVQDARQNLKDSSEQLSLFLDKYVDETRTYSIVDSAGQKYAIRRKSNITKRGKRS